MPADALAPIRLISGTILGDEVHTQIGTAILDGRLGPGERLRDVDLAQALGVSRTPVREALQRLERIGLVEVAVGRYTRVSVLDDDLRADTQEFATLLVGNALRVAVQRSSDESLAEIVERLDAVVAASATDDMLMLFAASHDFFACVIPASGNQLFVNLMEESAFAIRRNLAGWHPLVACPIQRTAEYAALRDAVAARDAAGAEQALRAIHGVH